MALIDEAKLVNIPSGYKAGTLFSVLPNTAAGDFDVARNSVANRVNSDIELQEMAVNVPRIQYDSGVTCPYLILEPQRTNLLTYPVSFDNAYWTKPGATIDDNGGAGYSAPHADSPLDVSAFKLVESSGGTTHYQFSGSVSFTSGNTYSSSIYAKKGERTWLQITSGNTTTYAIDAYFDLDNGVIGTVGFGTATITPMEDGWYRCTVTGTAGATTGTSLLTYLAEADNDNSYSGDGTSGAYLAFAQLEEGAYPTSFAYSIAGGEGATTTRLADVIDGAGAAATFNSVEGVYYLEIAALADDGTNRVTSISDGTNNNSIILYYSSVSNQIKTIVTVGTVAVANMSYTVTDETEFHKAAVRWKVNDFSLWVDGVERATDTSGVSFAADTLDELAFEEGGSGADFYGKCRELDVFEYLTDAQMAELTT